jgi:O-acetylserine/cysteine efflux transporter
VPLKDALLALLVAVLWGFNFVVMKIGVGEIPPLLLTALRFTFAALPAVLLVPPPSVSLWRLAAFAFVFGVAKFSLLFIGLKVGMPASLASVVLQLHVFFTILLAAALLGERPDPASRFGTLLALAGIGVIAASRWGGAEWPPLALVVAAAAMWSLANMIARGLGRVDMLAFAVWSSTIPPVPLLALSLVFEGPEAMAAAWQGLTWRGVGAVLYLAYPVSLAGIAIWNRLLTEHPTARIAPYALLTPCIGLAAGAVVLGEPIDGATALGGALVLAGLAAAVIGTIRRASGNERLHPGRDTPGRT